MLLQGRAGDGAAQVLSLPLPPLAQAQAQGPAAVVVSVCWPEGMAMGMAAAADRVP